MQHQTLPDPYRVTFDLMAGIEPITFPAGATVAEIAEQVTAAFAAAEVPIAVTVAIDLEGDAVTVTEDDVVIEHGSITRVDQQPDLRPVAPIVARALTALAAFGVTTEREAGQLLPMWLHFSELTAADRTAVYQHYRTEDGTR